MYTRQSSFPGMDPYLERNPCWEEFHGWFVRELARQNMDHARELGCVISAERSVYLRDPDHNLVEISEQWKE